MKKADVINYVEQFVCIHNAYNRLRIDAKQNDVWISLLDGIHVIDGIESLASAVCKSLTIEQINLENLKYELSFIYKNVRFFQLSDTDVLPEVVWDAD